ncbi:uncharacterized protein J3R85_010798 [Psidium guajava]|nr:uncharacterized protein J3R85_010798 [Psidium guajava]
MEYVCEPGHDEVVDDISIEERPKMNILGKSIPNKMTRGRHVDEIP